MDRTHETHITDTLMDVLTLGVAVVPWYRWYRWLNADRMTKKRWQGVQDRWDAMLEEVGDDHGWQLGFVDNERNDFLVLVLIDPEDRLVQPLSAKFED